MLVSGKARVRRGGQDFGVIGERMSPFEGKPWSVYVPAGIASWTVTPRPAANSRSAPRPAKGSCRRG